MILCSVGGQKQWIAIARAILRDTPILILEEATSALDAKSEHYIKEVIQALGHDCEVKRTILVMAHRKKLTPRTNFPLVGPTGSRKGMLLNLLWCLYEPIDCKRRCISTVEGNEPCLFHMDIISNICYGCRADLKQEDVERAAKLTHVHEFISSLPIGYRTKVDDSLLSGGQKQRIAIARAILRVTPILILDEATSALDAESEHYITEIIQALGHDCEVGPIGSEKSMLLNLLWHLHEPIGGKEPCLFHMDIISNICYGCPTDLKQEDVEKAAKLAHAHEFISSPPNGYSTCRPIGIARAILRDTPILILDEATSALDLEGEHYIKGLTGFME
ncbi:ABC transporter-like, ATP-binding domain [Dillenia turbinata]|uniref:ABC transporter-like, ATP-binding domain n=1 Tax=Dillenia turbinata TaxID=194707 RepID=A0AAN8VV66_9MAGN